jgi:hypothetical protein
LTQAVLPCAIVTLAAALFDGTRGAIIPAVDKERRRLMRAFIFCLALIAAMPVGAALAAEPSPGTAPASDADRCLFSSQVSGWSELDARNVVLRAGPRRFQVTFLAACRQARWAHAARVETKGQCVRPGDVIVFSSSDGFHERCIIDEVKLLPPGWKRPAKESAPP